MPTDSRKQRASPIGNALLIVVSLLVSIGFAEAVVRVIDRQPLLAFPMPEPIGTANVKSEQLDRIARAPGVQREWFFTDPPPLPNRHEPPEEWAKTFHFLERRPTENSEFRAADIFKAWNSVVVGDPCKHRFLRLAPGWLYLYDPPDGGNAPPYRFLPNATMPDRLVTNQIGWRGRPIDVPRKDKTVRIVFVGSSTTVDGHFLPFSYPEFIGNWLNEWAESKRLGVRFEVLNSARESNTSTDIEAIVRTEVLPLRPDLVVYYEGGNQFRPASIVDKVPEGSASHPPSAPASGQWLQNASRYSALLGRIQAAIGFARSDMDGKEWPKPDYRVVWPEGLDELDPDLSYPRLPVSLNVIQSDLDRIRADLATIGSQLAVSSFVWMVKDGMVLEPIRHKYILEQLNVGNYPFRYRELERLAKFQNRFFAKYAAVHGLPFIDVAGTMPLDPDLFIDAVHTSYAGGRLRAWAAFQQLLPVIEKHLADGSWPTPPPVNPPPLPTYTPRKITFDCTTAQK